LSPHPWRRNDRYGRPFAASFPGLEVNGLSCFAISFAFQCTTAGSRCQAWAEIATMNASCCGSLDWGIGRAMTKPERHLSRRKSAVFPLHARKTRAILSYTQYVGIVRRVFANSV